MDAVVGVAGGGEAVTNKQTKIEGEATAKGLQKVR